MEKFIPVVVIKELGETDKIMNALKNNDIHTAEITFRTACAAEAIALAVKNHPDMANLRADLAQKSLTLLMKEWEENRHIHENYNANTGEGCDSLHSDKFYHGGALLGVISMAENGMIPGFATALE